MKYFLSVLSPPHSGEGLALGIPTESVAAFELFTGGAKGPVEDAGDEQRFSLPHFFGFPGEEIRHGIILRGEGVRRVLLLTAVEREVEFTAAGIYRPPRVFGALGAFLSGLCFWTLDSGALLPLLLIDPFRLTEEMLHDQHVDC